MKQGPKPAKAALDGTTEERIKEAARKVFTQKGYAATRVKDIAEEAGINIALLSYYFRGKEKLFNLIMQENITQFAGSVQQIMMDEETTLEEKITGIVTFYIDLLTAQPELPLFIFNEINAHPEQLLARIGNRQLLASAFARQVQEKLVSHQNPVNPFQVIMSMLSMVVFPFIGRPMLQIITKQNLAEFNAMMQERKRLIPIWIEAILKGS